MTDPVVQSAAGSLGNWRARREAKGKPPSVDDMKREAAARWTFLTDQQIETIIDMCQKPRDIR